jgi:hypothetical protein
VGEQVEQEAVPELVGLAEVAAILGVSKQRVRELAERDDTFPLPAAELIGGAIYVKAMIEEFNKRWRREPGHPGKHQAQVLQELVYIPKAKADLGQQILRMTYHNLRKHDLSVDPLTPCGQSLHRAIELVRQNDESFRPRYDVDFFQLELPDLRYVKLHSQCCPEVAGASETSDMDGDAPS